MEKTCHSTQQIIEKLRQVDVVLGEGEPVADICEQLDITSQTYRRERQHRL